MILQTMTPLNPVGPDAPDAYTNSIAGVETEEYICKLELDVQDGSTAYDPKQLYAVIFGA